MIHAEPPRRAAYALLVRWPHTAGIDMPNDPSLRSAIAVELTRLGLSIETFPGGGLAGDQAGLDQLLARVRSLKPGATWRDVFPDLPQHWKPGQPDSWTTPYHPLGPFDYQELPTAGAIHIQWSRQQPVARLEQFVQAARSAGWPVHGAGLIDITNPDWPTNDAFLVLERGTSDHQLMAFADWINQQADFSVAAIPRTGDESYVDG